VADVSWVLFLIASTAIISSPGQDMILVMSRSIALGATAGVVTALGVGAGILIHTVLATLGVGAIVQASEFLFRAIKIVGAVYLLYLGVSMLRMPASAISLNQQASHSLVKLFFNGFISNIANPKIAIFFFAFLPQFVSSNASQPTHSIFYLGVGFAVLTAIIKVPVGYFSGQLSHWFRQQPKRLENIYRVSGLTLIGLGVKLVFEQRV